MKDCIPPPVSHHLFTSLVFTTKLSGASTQSLDDANVDAVADEEEEIIAKDEMKAHHREEDRFRQSDDEGAAGGWLEEDDIEDE
jgi:hypothetical protein